MNEQSIENWKCASDNKNNDFNEFTFEYDQIFITWWPIYHINDNIIEMLKYSLIITVYLKQM